MAVHIVGGRTNVVVVELNPNVIKGRVEDGIGKMCVRNGTLRCGTQEPIPRCRHLLIVLVVKLLETIRHVSVTCYH